MKLTKKQLKRIIKEELGKVLGEDMMDPATDIQDMLKEIAYWMEDHSIYSPEDGVPQWIALAREDGESISSETEQALTDMSDEIYNYMD